MATSAERRTLEHPASAKAALETGGIRRQQTKVKPTVAPTGNRRSAFSKSWSFVKIFDFDAMQRVQAIKQGLPATLPGDMASRMGMSKERLYVTLGLPRATVERKAGNRSHCRQTRVHACSASGTWSVRSSAWWKSQGNPRDSTPQPGSLAGWRGLFPHWVE